MTPESAALSSTPKVPVVLSPRRFASRRPLFFVDRQKIAIQLFAELDRFAFPGPETEQPDVGSRGNTAHFYPRRKMTYPNADPPGRCRIAQLPHRGHGYDDALVEFRQKIVPVDLNQVIEWRGVSNDDRARMSPLALSWLRVSTSSFKSSAS